jgi:hypothetical protein
MMYSNTYAIVRARGVGTNGGTVDPERPIVMSMTLLRTLGVLVLTAVNCSATESDPPPPSFVFMMAVRGKKFRVSICVSTFVHLYCAVPPWRLEVEPARDGSG